MTDSQKDPPRDRLDLRPLAPTDAERERVIGDVMARLASRPRFPDRTGLVEAVGELLPPMWAVAATALLAAGSMLAVARYRHVGNDATLYSTVASWTAAEHVPTNAELLLTFQGYAR